MTKFQKQMLTIAAAGALTAVTALPAMAFENEFHGFYNLRWFNSNYEQYGGGNPLATTGGYVTGPAGNTTNNLKNNNYFEQRSRIFYTAKASDDLMLKTGFELDSAWGSAGQSAASNQALGNYGRNSGGALETDTVNLETKWVYLDFKIPSTPIRATAGLQAFKDSLKGILFDFDGAGIMTKSKLGALDINAGYVRGYDNNLFSSKKYNTLGMDTLDFGVLEAKYNLSKDSNIGMVYYLLNDGRNQTITSTVIPPAYTLAPRNTAVVHTIGLTGETKLGVVHLSGFAAYQGGIMKPTPTQTGSTYLNALAYNVAADAQVGIGKLRTALLFTSGNDTNGSNGSSHHQTGWYSVDQSGGGTWAPTTGTNSYNESGMFLLNRNALAQSGTTDNSIVYNSGNGDTPQHAQGLYLYTLGYDATITPKLYINSNIGFAWAAHNNNQKPVDRATGQQNASNFMGTEINTEVGYKMYPNLTASVGVAYVALGGYYKGSAANTTVAKDPDNPYTGRVTLKYNF